MRIFSLYSISFKSTKNPSMWEVYSIRDKEIENILKSDNINKLDLTAAYEYPDI